MNTKSSSIEPGAGSRIRTPHSERAFTMIEIAVSLAIIGFALVAIIGVLPIGMNVQKDNREETIINQDSTVFMNAIRSGSMGLDDLTNYVMAITNSVTKYDQNQKVVGTWRDWYTTTSSSVSPTYPLTNAFRIVGLLSIPKYVRWTNPGKGGGTGIISNNVVADVRSMSGPSNEKFPQDNQAVKDFAFSYRMTSEVVPYWTNYFDPAWVNASNTATVNTLQANLCDLRLIFRWPLRSNGQLGPGSQSFRTLVGGQLLATNDYGQLLYLFQPSTYVKAQ